MEQKQKRKLTRRELVILLLAVVVLAEGAFLLLHRRPAAEDTASPAAAVSAEPGQEAAGSAGETPDTSADASVSAAPDASASPDGADKTDSGKDDQQAGKSDAKKDDKKGDNQGASGGSAAPAQTPAVSIPPEDQGKPYAGAVAAITNYIKSPSEATMAYLLGGELMGEQMQRFLPALLTMSGQTADVLETELDASLNLPDGTKSLTIADAQALTAEELGVARERVQIMQTSFAGIADGFADAASFTDDDWTAIGEQLGLSGAEAKQLLTELTASSKTMAGLLDGADVTEGYRVTLKTNTGGQAQTNVYCIAGKWVTSAFFNMQFE